jgi:hypothetical protein
MDKFFLLPETSLPFLQLSNDSKDSPSFGFVTHYKQFQFFFKAQQISHRKLCFINRNNEIPFKICERITPELPRAPLGSL